MIPKPSSKLVLYVEDDEDARLFFKRAFTKSGVVANLQMVDDGSTAIQYLSGEGEYSDRNRFPLPDLLLLDLNMRIVSGFGVLEYLKSRKDKLPFPVIVFSSSNQDSDKRRAQDLGSDAYWVKPSEFQALIALVNKIDAEYLNSGAGETKTTKPAVLFEKAAPANMRFPADELSAKTLSESPQIFRFLVEQVKDYAIFMLSTSGTILSWNEGARQIKGYEAHEIIGKHFSIFYPPIDLENNKPQDELRMAADIGRYEEEGWRVKKDGSRFWANVVISPLRGSTGPIQGFAKVTQDLTQRKRQEDSFQKLLESEERFRLLVEQVKDYAIFILDARGRVTSWNQGAKSIKGYSSEEIIGKHFSIFYIAEDLASDKPARELATAIQVGRYEEEGWRLRKDGSRFWGNVVITSLWDKRGNLTGFAKVTRDLTDRKREEDALKQKTRELEAFAHTLSHDLKSPLRSISNFAQILKTEANDLTEKEKAEYLDKIFHATASMSQLIDGLLKLSQIGSVEAPVESVPLAAILAESMALLDSEIKTTNAEIQVQGPLPNIRANPILMLQTISNLLSNAIKFRIKGEVPKIEIFVTGDEKVCEIHFKDHGIGILPQFRDSVFNIFERAGADSNSDPGMGVGLAIVKRAMERMGGKIEVKSERGNGSEFIVALPQ